MVVTIYSKKPAFYRQKPRGGRREKIRGANAPLISTKEPRIRGLAVWPQLGGTAPRFEIQLYLVLDFPLQLLILIK